MRRDVGYGLICIGSLVLLAACAIVALGATTVVAMVGIGLGNLGLLIGSWGCILVILPKRRPQPPQTLASSVYRYRAGINALLLSVAFGAVATAQDWRQEYWRQRWQAEWDERNIEPAELRQNYRNPDGSCVYCSLGMCGVHHGSDNIAQILHDSKYGSRCRGGSYPSRVGSDLRRRNVAAWNIEGDTMPWIEWALSTNRYCAITLTPSHMQCVMAMSPDKQYFGVCDNNSPRRIDSWTRSRFLSEHRRMGGGWAVILQGPKPLPWIAPQRTAEAFARVERNDEAGYVLR